MRGLYIFKGVFEIYMNCVVQILWRKKLRTHVKLTFGKYQFIWRIMMSNPPLPSCGRCPFAAKDRICTTVGGKHPANCPTVHLSHISKETCTTLENNETLLHAMLESSITEACGYTHRTSGTPRPGKPRIVEIIEFAKRMQYTRLGLVFCLGLRQEAATTTKILEANGFEVVSVVCKVGAVPKEDIGVPPSGHINCKGGESMCNPITQANVCNSMNVDFNILLGLCVGHDSLVLKHLDAMATVFAVKDRLLGHNPLAAIYNAQSYYRYLMAPLTQENTEEN